MHITLIIKDESSNIVFTIFIGSGAVGSSSGDQTAVLTHLDVPGPCSGGMWANP